MIGQFLPGTSDTYFDNVFTSKLKGNLWDASKIIEISLTGL